MRLPTLLLVAATLNFVSARAAEPQVLDGVAALVGQDVITFSQVRELTGQLEKGIMSNLSGTQRAEKIKEVRLRAVNDLIDRQLIIQEFRKMKAQIPTHVVDDRINTVIREEFGGDRSAFLRTIAAQGFTMERLRKMEEEKVIVQAMRAREVKNEPIIPAGRVESFYRQNIQQWTVNDEVKLRMIKIVAGSMPEKKRKMLQEIREDVLRGKDFGDLARLYSEDSTQEANGDWGWVKRGDLAGGLEQAVFAQKTGKVSEVIEMNQTFYLLLVEARKGGTVKPLKDVRGEIERFLMQQERQKMQQAWIDRLRKKAFIKIY